MNIIETSKQAQETIVGGNDVLNDELGSLNAAVANEQAFEHANEVSTIGIIAVFDGT